MPQYPVLVRPDPGNVCILLSLQVVWQAADGSWPLETALAKSTHVIWSEIKDMVQDKFIVPVAEMTGPELRHLVMKLQEVCVTTIVFPCSFVPHTQS